MLQRQRITAAALPLAGILLVAVNLRPAITSVGPVLPLLGSDLGLGPSALGLLAALPIAAFGLVSVVVQPIIARFGVERTVAGALALLTLATVLRSWPGARVNLWLGTALVGATVAVGNVAVPVIVKKFFPQAAALVTSIYVAVLGIFAGLAAALAVPLAQHSALGWRLSLGVWAGLTFLGLLFWATRALQTPTADTRRRNGSSGAGQTGASVWSRAPAWQISAYMGLQSSVFYVSLTWLPTVEQSLGISPVAAGWHMFVLQVVGMVGNLVAPVLMRIGNEQRLATILPGVLFLIAVTGIFVDPGLIVLWVIVLGLGSGMAFVVALSLIAVRAADLTTAGRLSSMAQSVGYGIAAVALYIAGAAQEWNALAALAVIGAAAVAVVATGVFAGRRQLIGQPSQARK